MKVLPHIVRAPIMLASAISSSVAPKRRAASVWKSAQYLHRVAPETATPMSSLYLFGILVSLSQKSRAMAQKPCMPSSGISSIHCGTRPISYDVRLRARRAPRGLDTKAFHAAGTEFRYLRRITEHTSDIAQLSRLSTARLVSTKSTRSDRPTEVPGELRIVITDLLDRLP